MKTDKERLRRMIENGKGRLIFSEEDESTLRELSGEMGTFSVHRRTDYPSLNERGASAVMIEVRIQS